MDSSSRGSSSSHRRDHDRKEARDKDRDKDRKHRHHDRYRDDDDNDRHKKHKSSSSSSKSRHHDRDDEDDDKHSRRSHHKSSSSRHDRDRDRSSRSRKEDKEDKEDVDMAEDDDDMWVEKEVSAPVSSAPALTVSVTSKPEQESGTKDNVDADVDEETDKGPKRDSWMTDAGGMDFGLMGALKVKKPKEDKPNPDKVYISERELNTHLKSGLHVDQYPVQEKPSYTIGDAGSSWRMTKLKRVLESAEERGVAPEIVGVERYGSIEKFDEAMHERRELDRRSAKKKERRGDRRDDSKDSMDSRDSRDSRKEDKRRDDSDHRRDRDDKPPRSGRLSEFSSAASSPFQRPMDEEERLEKELARRLKDKEREKEQERRFTPIPSPFATHVSSPMPNHTAAEPTMTADQLNKLRAKAMRAKMMGMPDADALEKEFEEAQKAVAEAASKPVPAPESNRVVVVQTMGRGSGSSSPAPLGAGNVPPKKKKKEVTHDKQGNRIAYDGEENDLDLHELVRREKLGLEDSMDRELERRITRDAAFREDIDYLDDNADRIARTVKKNDAQIKSSAINDYRKTQTALDKCNMCYKDDGKTAPQMAVVSMGTRIYLGLPLYKEFLPGHCMIVPIQHVTSTLELDDDAWDEIRNFMKCLIQMNAAEDKAVIFSETVINLKWQKHTVIECIPIPWQAGQAAPGYFKEAILNSDEEWSQHKKLIETDAKVAANGGFRRRLTSKMPFVHVWLGSPDKGYGHVIEDADRFEDYFVKEVLASVCEMDSSQWRRRDNKRIPQADNPRRVEAFKKTWTAWDWTRTLEGK
ncbi:hypothetical protein BG015_006179 [Linnemannia schmuckeri]|uniref:Uncharacterized protein n=1 Tax=Linnemannia schmuckeri TaxID=64567 RepID=A0A9P5VBY8_9FUNG|nr:hypothetical protein BG015_006179 [Linnemannia schmuckeri]